VLTNAAGGLRPETQNVGDPVLISDHINLTGANPITGATFIDLTSVYSPRLRELAREAGAEVLGVSLVTNPGAGLSGEPLDHEEVLAVGHATAARMGVLLAKVIGSL
jgi:purine-nucleoside phosphorylase